MSFPDCIAGIGWATTVIVFLLNCYYNVILAWAFYYLFASFSSVRLLACLGNPTPTPNEKEKKEITAKTTECLIGIVLRPALALHRSCAPCVNFLRRARRCSVCE